MVKVKLIVFFIYFSTVVCCASYCEICSQHTLCKYTMWSEELATFAERWVNQCDQSFRPDKEDQCRDLVNSSVGQNIASILDPSPDFKVKSFVDIWSMPMLEYFGSVAYYNQTRNHKTYYFTQLIWADTDMVGCGRARFYHHKQKTMLERLVCNFAPKGNIHGRPIYNIGYPATQCPVNTRPDNKFKGLCKRQIQENERKLTPSSYRPRVSSLLRIVNLSNTSVKQEIDPVRNHWKHLKLNINKTIEQRHQKTRHVFNNTNGSKKLVHHSNWKNYMINTRRPDEQNYPQEYGHSHVHHSYNAHKNVYTLFHQRPTEVNIRRFDYSTDTFNSYTHQGYRKYNKNDCTRKMKYPKNIFSIRQNIYGKCTRKNVNSECLQPTESCEATKSTYCTNNNVFRQELCSCTTPVAITNVVCSSSSTCSNFRRQEAVTAVSTRPAELHYYDLLPKTGVPSGNIIDDNISLSPLRNLMSTSAKRFKTTHKQHRQKQMSNIYVQSSNNDHDYFSYNPFDLHVRKKRGDEKFKPFWQVSEFNPKISAHLKSIKYTTLRNKNKKATKKNTKNTSNPTSTEPITIKIKDTSNLNVTFRIHNQYPITEKYLSFDELMHLRKMGITDIETDSRRKANDALRNTNADTSTTEITANTPFVRKKHCTRKLTCTWTASSPTGADGSVIAGGNIDRGSRTPPGYVDGCTRTSTCTRDFMGRNKIATVSEESLGEPTPDNEDYCERKSLNIRKRNTNLKQNAPFSSKRPRFNNEDTRVLLYSQTLTTTNSQANCICYKDNFRRKRDGTNNQLRADIANNVLAPKSLSSALSYGDLYFLVLHKIIGNWKSKTYSDKINECLCNFCVTLRSNIVLIFLLFICNVYYIFIL
ncbi:uncharacterized protein LOC131850500 isoform X2 [Achroia grisella]|uniref:uncharacterized protein LOC131850500 isoform X2 n=1 Tax=Achroia grisella TaxID=688607 RepID=UPI0027D2910C|nr:uncharacterized protein LOC131850500 isoform X2 [Achroia grisella]